MITENEKLNAFDEWIENKKNDDYIASIDIWLAAIAWFEKYIEQKND